MKKILAIILTLASLFCFASCKTKSTSSTAQITEDPARAAITPGPQYAYDYAKMQETYPEMAVRIVEDSTTVKFTVGDKVLYGSIDNEVETGVAFLNALPMTIKMARSEAFMDGQLESEFDYKSNDVHFGWLNGDIDYYVPEHSLRISFMNQDFSYEENGHVNIGSIHGNLSDWMGFDGEYEVKIEVVSAE